MQSTDATDTHFTEVSRLLLSAEGARLSFACQVHANRIPPESRFEHVFGLSGLTSALLVGRH